MYDRLLNQFTANTGQRMRGGKRNLGAYQLAKHTRGAGRLAPAARYAGRLY